MLPPRYGLASARRPLTNPKDVECHRSRQCLHVDRMTQSLERGLQEAFALGRMGMIVPATSSSRAPISSARLKAADNSAMPAPTP